MLAGLAIRAVVGRRSGPHTGFGVAVEGMRGRRAKDLLPAMAEAGNPGKSAEDERVADGSGLAMKRSNVRGQAKTLRSFRTRL